MAQADEAIVAPLVDEPEEDNETSLLLSGSETTMIPPDETEQQLFRRTTLVTSPGQMGEDGNHDLSNGYLPAIVVEDADRLKPQRTRSHFFHSFPNSPNQSRLNLVSETSSPGDSTPTQGSSTDAEDSEDDPSLPSHRRARSPTVPTSSRRQSFFRRFRRQIRHGWKSFNEFMTVPLWAAVASLIVACIQPLQHALDQHMQPIKGALASAGNCSIPLTLIVLGAYFYKPKETPEEAERGRSLSTKKSTGSLLKSVREALDLKSRWKNHNRRRTEGSVSSIPKPEGQPGETRTVIIAILSRMVIVPLLLMPLMALSAWYDWQAVFAE